MSADNWARCPKCLKEAKTECTEIVDKLDSAYGKVSIEEFKKLEVEKKNKLAILSDETYTLREDYEFFMTADGILEI